MLKNYLKIAIRNIVKQKTYSFINISGLTVGMASFILIALWVQDEFNFDKSHKNFDYIYRVLNHENYSDGEEFYFTQCPAGLAPVLKSEYPEMTKVSRVRNVSDIIFNYKNKRFSEDDVLFVDPSFFQIFTVPISNENVESIFEDPLSIAITEEMAEKYFGSENPIGKLLRLDNKVDLKISGILKNAPVNSHIQYNFILPFQRLKDINWPTEGWNSFAYATYILLDKKADHKNVSSKISNIIKAHDESAIVTSSLQSIKDVHLFSSKIGGLGGEGDIKYIYIFSAIAVFILLTACINFMNLSTARSGKRAKEVGLRKVIGADRKEIIFQFFNESLIISFIAMTFAFALVSIVLPAFNLLSGKFLEFSLFGNPQILLIIIFTMISTGIISGSYPAIFLSSFQPIKTLKGTLSSGKKGTLFRRVLVSFQFVLTICLIFGTIVVNRQLHFIKNQKLGYDKDQVLCISLQGNLSQKAELLKNELKINSEIINISAATNAPSRVRRSFVAEKWEGNIEDEKYLATFIEADENYLNTVQLQLVQGRYFSKEFISDSSAVVINEAALSVMGMENPIGKSIMEDYHIIGVIKNFHFQSLHRKISPLLIFYKANENPYLLVKINSADITETISALENKWQVIVPDYPMEFQFLEEHIDRLYRTDRQTGKIINIFSFLSLFIAILGLFGMASFVAEQRTKEIGIRKVLGGTITGILTLLSKEFVKWILIANVIAFPIGWFAMNKWLQSFAYRIDLNIWFFFASGLLALGIALITVLFQTTKAAIANPVDSLRTE